MKPIVTCEDGSKYSGDIVVGCDGVHSVVRMEMWRITDGQVPGKIPSSDKDCFSSVSESLFITDWNIQTVLTAKWRGLYGISGPVKGLETGNVQVVASRDEACYWFVLKDGNVIWSLIEKLDKKYHLPNIPRYADEDKRLFAESKLDKILVSDKEEIKFGDLWKNLELAVLVPLEEGVLRGWACGQIVCVGDSVHKV